MGFILGLIKLLCNALIIWFKLIVLSHSATIIMDHHYHRPVLPSLLNTTTTINTDHLYHHLQSQHCTIISHRYHLPLSSLLLSYRPSSSPQLPLVPLIVINSTTIFPISTSDQHRHHNRPPLYACYPYCNQPPISLVTIAISHYYHLSSTSLFMIKTLR